MTAGTTHVDVIALALAAACVAVVMFVADAHRPPGRVPIGAEPGGGRPPAGTNTGERWSAPRGRGTGSEALGRAIRSIAGRQPDPEADRRSGWVALATVVLVVVAPPLSPAPIVWATIVPTLAVRRRARAHEAAVIDQLPDVIDLLALTTSAGLPVVAAFATIGSRPGGPLGAGLSAAAAHAARGGTTAEALALLARAAGAPGRPLIDALAEHDRYGTPLRPALDRVAIESRLRRRRHAEEAARRLPVTLLFPLVLTVLPAFVLLTIVPIMAGSLGSLSP